MEMRYETCRILEVFDEETSVMSKYFSKRSIHLEKDNHVYESVKCR